MYELHIEPPGDGDWEELAVVLRDEIAEALHAQHAEDLERLHRSISETKTPPLMASKVLAHVRALHAAQVEFLADQLQVAYVKQAGSLH